jgi:hypothetical protein
LLLLCRFLFTVIISVVFRFVFSIRLVIIQPPFFKFIFFLFPLIGMFSIIGCSHILSEIIESKILFQRVRCELIVPFNSISCLYHQSACG